MGEAQGGGENEQLIIRGSAALKVSKAGRGQASVSSLRSLDSILSHSQQFPFIYLFLLL